MKPGDIIETTVTRLGAQGDGLAETRGHPVYVPLALPDELIRVKLGRTIGDGFEGQLLEVLKPSPARITPPCPHFSQCGGCTLQHLAAKEYAAHKKAVVQGALRQHRLDDDRVRDPLVLPAHSRRRLTMAALLAGKDRVILGFNARASHHLVDLAQCPIARPELISLLPRLRTVLLPWLQRAKALDLSLIATDTGVDLLLTGPEPDLAGREAVSLLAQEPAIARVSWRKSERASSEPMLALHPPAVRIAGHSVVVPPGAFLQASHEGEVALTGQVLAATGQPDGPVADLFAGLGTFSLPLSSRADVLAVEGDATLLAALAALRLPNIRTEQRDLFREPLGARELERFAAVVFDPPRAGAQAQAAEIARSRVPVVVAVSCNPGTFARDALQLCANGYELDWVQPVDQFLWSGHIELVARFSRS